MINIHEQYMRMALKEAEQALHEGEVPIGVVIVSHGRVIAKAHNQTERLNDATAHAEMIAITAAAHALGSKYLTDCAMYVTVEPCMMCATALFWSKIGALFYGASDNKYGYTHLNTKLFNTNTHIEHGYLEEECGQLMRDFFRKKREIDKLK